MPSSHLSPLPQRRIARRLDGHILSIDVENSHGVSCLPVHDAAYGGD
jgi:hypothetical protein